ncbi:unnamed protein product [Orchesella dallaii]|uniref:Transmembrane protein n=1 Tax=Orchesella dallaii TaxID=48710 RepID=A0ABP1QBT7_9HEXA
MDELQSHCLPTLLKLYIYGLHGYFVEVTFTALWDLIAVGNFRLQGCSSIWSLGIYGSCGLALEKLSKKLRDKKVPIYFRALIYVLVIYLWEYTSGTLLRLISACPWDYMEFRYNFGGLITLEYAPFWLLAGIMTERIIMGRLEQLRWVGIGHSKNLESQSSSANGFASTNGLIKMKRND